MSWSSALNGDDLIENFNDAVAADVPTKGSWLEDFSLLCEKYGITPCPFITSSPSAFVEDKSTCRISNAEIDLSSWRAMLLACCTVGNTVNEISVHSCYLTNVHISELALALRKSTCCTIVRLQYLTLGDFDQKRSEYGESFQALLSDETCLAYLSLKGSTLPDAFVNDFIPALSSNFKLNSLNLAGLKLSDETCTNLFNSIRLTTNIRNLSLAGNNLTGACLAALTRTLVGHQAEPNDEANYKSNLKTISDKNKAIKESNKKKKKSGAPEVVEVAPSVECIVLREKVPYLVNRSLKYVDFSDNTMLEETHIGTLNLAISETPQGVALPEAANIHTVGTGSANSDEEAGKSEFSGITLCFKGVGISDTLQDMLAEKSPPQWLQLLISTE